MNELKVYAILRDAALNWPNNPAIHDEYGTLTFLELFQETELLKEKFIAAGIKPGMGIGLMARNGRHFITGIFAVIGCGATVMPLSHQLKFAEIDELLHESRLNAVIFETGLSRHFNPVAEAFHPINSEFQLLQTDNFQHTDFAGNVKNPAFVRFTSGTTGKSKGVIISHQSVMERIEGANQALCLGPGDTVIWVLPMAFHFIVSIVLYIRFGATIAVVKDFLAKNIIEVTDRFKGTLLYASPMQIRLLANDTGQSTMPSLKKVISTSAGISADVCHVFRTRFNIEVCQAYGIIEIGLPIINTQRSADQRDAVGYALPGYSVEIFDDNHHIVPAGVLGHLGIKGPGMFDAYLCPSKLREDVLVNGYFLTADYATKSVEGIIKIEGREKSVINVSGNKVFPEEVESLLETLPSIKQARISGAPHPIMGQVVQLEILPNQGYQIDVEEVLTYCRKRLSTYKVPQKVKIVDSMPMTASGKIIRY